ncbi:replication initiator [Leucobacter sp.]
MSTTAERTVQDPDEQHRKQVADALEALGVTLPCQRPVHMNGVNPDTGEAVELEMRCNTRKARICPSCAALYRGDIKAIMREGIHTAQSQGDAVVFLTLTAPSFGATHYVAPTPPPRLSSRRRTQWSRRYQRRCSCGVQHAPGERRYLGVPVSTGGYDYGAQVRWNLAAGRLWSRTADELTRILDVRDCEGKLQRLPYAAVAEWQSRGAIHLHVIARIPRDRLAMLQPMNANERGSGALRLKRLEDEATAVTTTVDGETIGWGTQCVAEVVSTERQMLRTAGYFAKAVMYAVKDLTAEAGEDAPHSPELAMHHKRLHAAAARLRCGTRPTSNPNASTLGDDEARWLRCSNDQLNGKPGTRRGCRSQRHYQWGWRGHAVRRSRSWSVLTITECRRRRREHHAPEGHDTEAWVWERPSNGEPIQGERYTWERLQETMSQAVRERAKSRAASGQRTVSDR